MSRCEARFSSLGKQEGSVKNKIQENVHVLCSCCMFPDQADRFVRNSLYRGSLTQRNPAAKPKTRATSAVWAYSVVLGTVKSLLPIFCSFHLEKSNDGEKYTVDAKKIKILHSHVCALSRGLMSKSIFPNGSIAGNNSLLIGHAGLWFLPADRL